MLVQRRKVLLEEFVEDPKALLEACDRRGLDVLGVVVSHSAGPLSEADAANLHVLKDALGPRLIGEVPACRRGNRPDPESAGVSMIREFLVRPRPDGAGRGSARL